jgi:hypothetical protein
VSNGWDWTEDPTLRDVVSEMDPELLEAFYAQAQPTPQDEADLRALWQEGGVADNVGDDGPELVVNEDAVVLVTADAAAHLVEAWTGVLDNACPESRKIVHGFMDSVAAAILEAPEGDG